ncbi:protein FAR-RED IMPAIRED RESPONSE 1-like [Arachis ipaensis]|uniref:protein FAR-RED IMPAIRED RESPONSE 1-like n=1 Tax=Arachis ipaensis TaxID=130454 RepID=UPI000A2B96B1|nr:protein FAR-RED IMPAIRED RESPONSE 1-like [Arachis ipaensis]
MQGAELSVSISEMLFHLTLPTIQTGIIWFCGSFFGVNHHGQSTLLGCALMKNEDTESFKWLFQCWLRCMGGNALKGILTDQCASMQRAIEACMPTTIHHWCILHIMKKIPNKLNGYKGHVEIEQEMSHVV